LDSQVSLELTDRHLESAQFDTYAETYDRAVNRSIAFLPLKVDYFTQVKANYLIGLAKRHFGETRSLRMLDIGCGVGNSHGLLVHELSSITGTDVSSSCLAQAAERNPGCTYRPYDGEKLPWNDGCFDVAVTTCVMHHVVPAQWPTFTAEMKRVVRNDGLVVVFEHNPLNPLTRRAVSNCEFDDDAVLLGQRRTRRLLSDAGLRGVRSRSILTVPSFGPMTRQLDLLLGRLSLGAQYFAHGTV
jgi:ubiquinone/menaquinone biosynthesis C-methylase UbiE